MDRPNHERRNTVRLAKVGGLACDTTQRNDLRRAGIVDLQPLQTLIPDLRTAHSQSTDLAAYFSISGDAVVPDNAGSHLAPMRCSGPHS